jgi:redox-sensitive bicupin YhaK (pirin superfamily)
VPERASFAALRDAEAPRYEEAPGVETKELVGPQAALPVNGDIRFFADTRLRAGSEITMTLGAGEGALLYPLEGELTAGEETVLTPGQTLIVPPGDGERSVTVSARTDARLLRTIFGQGRGLLTGPPMARRGS